MLSLHYPKFIVLFLTLISYKDFYKNIVNKETDKIVLLKN
ncbi:hypothetical protein ACSSV5_001391 [Psychroflexus sp. MBR-150]|jgi:hypothetical protein